MQGIFSLKLKKFNPRQLAWSRRKSREIRFHARHLWVFRHLTATIANEPCDCLSPSPVGHSMTTMTVRPVARRSWRWLIVGGLAALILLGLYPLLRFLWVVSKSP